LTKNHKEIRVGSVPDLLSRSGICKFYDVESLSQEKIDSELKRLHKEIEDLEHTLIYLEKHEPGHPDKMDFYSERIKVRSQLDAIYVFLSDIEHERIADFIKNSKLRQHGKLPDWRVKELKKKKANWYYHLKYPY